MIKAMKVKQYVFLVVIEQHLVSKLVCSELNLIDGTDFGISVRLEVTRNK